jgi:hypothetical protein
VKIPEYSWCRSRAPCNQRKPDSIPRRRGQPGSLGPACSYSARPGEQSSWRAKALPRGVSRAFATGARKARPSSCTYIGGVGRVARGRWRGRRMQLAANQQRRRAEIMPGGVIVELEIARPQFRYVAHISKMVRHRCDPRRQCHLRPLMRRNLVIFAAEPGPRGNQQKPPALCQNSFQRRSSA